MFLISSSFNSLGNGFISLFVSLLSISLMIGLVLYVLRHIISS